MSAKTYDSALDNPNAEKKGLAITAFIISLINLICCFTSASIILVPIVLILAIISIATHRGAKGLAIAAIIIGLIAAIIYGTVAVVFREPIRDINMFTATHSSISMTMRQLTKFLRNSRSTTILSMMISGLTAALRVLMTSTASMLTLSIL